ncbi:virion structural protein_gp106 [Bacillus phage vB_BceM_WH1]|nr:virion structural protein_gp106 [Bacillus phage vB_BceM_WH1]
MAANPFLVTYVYPANKEQNVAVDTKVRVRFQADMNVSSLNEGTVYLTKVNGAKVACTYEYVRTNKELIVSPTAPLEPLAQYELMIIGESNGVKTVLGDIIGVNKVYSFSTKGEASVSEPQSFVATVKAPTVKFSWLPPITFIPTEQVVYHLFITEGNTAPDAPVIWPVGEPSYAVTQQSLEIPITFKEGTYTAHIKSKQKDIESKWVSATFVVEKKTEETKPPVTEQGLRMIDSFPKNNSLDMKEKEVFISFSEKLDESTVDATSVYMVEAEGKNEYSPMELYTTYAPSKAVEGVVISVEEGRVIKVVLPEKLEENKIYTIILRSKIASEAGLALGITHSITFYTPMNPFYVSIDIVRLDVGHLIGDMSDIELAKRIHEASKEAYQIASKSKAFDATLYKDGKFPYEVGQYVRCKVAYGLLLDTCVRMGAGGKEAIKLGDLQVEDKSSVSDVMSLMRYFQNAMKPWLDWMHGHFNRGYAKPTSVQRGGVGNPFPPFIDRVTLKQMN